MNPFIIGMGAMILFVGLLAELDWYRKYKQFYFQWNGGGSLIFTGIGLVTFIGGFFMADMPEYTADPIEIIKAGGHR